MRKLDDNLHHRAKSVIQNFLLSFLFWKMLIINPHDVQLIGTFALLDMSKNIMQNDASFDETFYSSTVAR